MGWRRRPRTINEELLAEGWPTSEPTGPPRSSRQRRAAFALFLLVAWFALHFVHGWAQVIIGILVVAELLWIFTRSTNVRTAGSAKVLNVLLHVWGTTCVLATILFALDGFDPDERALLGVVWPLLGLIWVGYRLRSARATARPETGSESDP